MASLSTDQSGNRTIQFVARDGKRRSIRLGKLPKRLADSIKVKIEALNVAIVSGLPMDGETATWVAGIGADLADKLSAVGLIPPRASATLGGFLTDFIARRGQDKPRTADNLEQCRRRVVEFFGADRDMRSVTPADADHFLVWLKERFAATTAARTFRRARQFFHGAVRARLLSANPLEGVKTPGEVDTSKQVFLTAENVLKVMEELPSTDLRTVVAVARFGGLRVPSEIGQLRWDDILWDKCMMRVTSPKTEHHGKGERFVPLFPQLRKFLNEAWDAAPAGAEFVIQANHYRDGGANLRTPLRRGFRNAGVAFPPKVFMNMRSSLETELCEEFPMHKVVYWLGNSVRIAQKHYLQIRDEDYLLAAQGGAKSGAVVVQNPVQQAAAGSCGELQETAQGVTPCSFMPLGSSGRSVQDYTRQDSNQSSQPPDGVGHLRHSCEACAAKSGAVGADEDLRTLVGAWSSLPPHVRRTILSLVREFDERP